MHICDMLTKDTRYVDPDIIRRELQGAEASNRVLALEYAHARYAEYEALAAKREAARVKLGKSQVALQKMHVSKSDLESRVGVLTLTGDADGLKAAQDDYRGLVEKYIPNGERAIARDEAAYEATEYNPKAANASLFDDMQSLLGHAGWNPRRPTESAQEANEIYTRYVAPCEKRAKEFRKEEIRRKHEANFEQAIDEGRARNGDGTTITR